MHLPNPIQERARLEALIDGKTRSTGSAVKHEVSATFCLHSGEKF